MLGFTYPAIEVVLEVLGQLQPGCSGNADPLRKRRQIPGDGPALVVANRPTGPVDQLLKSARWQGSPSGLPSRTSPTNGYRSSGVVKLRDPGLGLGLRQSLR